MASQREIEQLQEQVDVALLSRSEKPLAGLSVLVTGATRMNGIGFAIAERLALDGASPVILVGTKASEQLAPFAKTRLERYGVSVHTFVGDVTNQESCREMTRKAYELCEDGVSILVNNAGVNRNQTFNDITAADWEAVMRPKSLGALLMSVEWFRIRNEVNNLRGGRVVNIGSVVGRYGNFGQVVYAMANEALVGLTRALSWELGRQDVRVNLIAPGFVPGTEITTEMSDEEIEGVRTTSALNALVRASDVASAVSYLVGPDGERVTGETFIVDAGVMSNYTAARKMRQAGFRRVPRYALGVVEGLTPAEVELIKKYRQSAGVEGSV